MRQMAGSLRNLVGQMIVVPDDAQCPVCGYFDITHPDLRRLVEERDGPRAANTFLEAQCKCKSIQDKRKRDEQLRWTSANLPHQQVPKVFTNFTVTQETEEACTLSKSFARLEGKPFLIFLGQTGSGKSHLLEAIAREVLSTTKATVRYDTTSGFLDRLRDTYQDKSEQSTAELLGWYQRRTVVLLDDLGVEKNSDWVIERLTEFIDERLRSGWRTAIATNLVREEVAQRMGERLASRLFQTREELGEVRRITLRARDYRQQPRSR